jgi:hypothetical protein
MDRLNVTHGIGTVHAEPGDARTRRAGQDATGAGRGECDETARLVQRGNAQIGGVAGGGGEYCAPIPDGCRSTPTCACLGSCACGASFGRPETCSDGRDQDGGQTIQCDNGI